MSNEFQNVKFLNGFQSSVQSTYTPFLFAFPRIAYRTSAIKLSRERGQQVSPWLNSFIFSVIVVRKCLHCKNRGQQVTPWSSSIHGSVMTWTNQGAISWWMQLRNAVSIFYWRIIHFIFTTLLHHVTKISQKTLRSTTLFLFTQHFHPMREKHYSIVEIKTSPAGSYFCKCKHFLATITEKINEFNQGDTCWPLSRDNFIADVQYSPIWFSYTNRTKQRA